MEYSEFNTDKIFSISNHAEFEETSLEVFLFQYNNCPFYNKFCSTRHINPDKVSTIQQIPFLPIQFFKNEDILRNGHQAQVVFTSSGTTGMTRSRHLVSDTNIYERSFKKCFEYFFGNPETYTILALLPSYLERKGSSLVYMTQKLIDLSGQKDGGFYLYNHTELAKKLEELDNAKQPTILFGVSFALLDFTSKFKLKLNHCKIIETGGMKGHGKELTREELHETLRKSLGVETIYSEYGMTELLSQAYTIGNTRFKCPPWMKTLARDIYDPYNYVPSGITGGINIIDLANINSCAFIETEDLGKVFDDGTFEISGRYDKSELRGCNLMI